MAGEVGEEIVSVRMPVSLYSLLKEKSQSHHYLDISEALRSVCRKKYEQSKSPLLTEIGSIKQLVSEKLKGQESAKVLEELQELKRLLGGLE